MTSWLPPRDLRTLHWFGSGDWRLLLYILGTFVITVKVLLPRFMLHREEFQLLKIIRVYNLILIAINCVFFYLLSTRTYLGGGYSWYCQGIDTRRTADTTVVAYGYYYMFVRIFEFADTIFFVLRKKFNQASVLNITHHCLAVALPWYGLAYGMDGQIALMVSFNMFVHVIMYSYYFLASIPSMQPYLTWKKHLTKLQLLQFAVVVVHMSIPIFHDCGYPKQNSILVVGSYLYFIVMFSKFYGSAYDESKRSAKINNKTSLVEKKLDDIPESSQAHSKNE